MCINELELAKADDYDEIVDIYIKAISNMNRQGIFQWDFDLYPNKQVLLEDINNGEMYVIRNGDTIISAVVINEEQDIAYESISWQFSCDKIAVIHRLCVNPEYQHMGISYKMLALCEKYLKDLEYEAIRLDAFSENPYALKLYDKSGYYKCGDTMFKPGKFYLFEKSL